MRKEPEPRRVEPLGARHVATWGPDGSHLARTAPGEGHDRLMTAAEYVAGLPDRRPTEEIDAFLASGGTMATFELRRGGARRALGVKVIPYRTSAKVRVFIDALVAHPPGPHKHTWSDETFYMLDGQITTPVLFGEPLTADTCRIAFSEVYAVLARQRDLSRFSWETPAFREVCAEIGLDPDERRPRYRSEYAELAGTLEHWIGDVFTDDARATSPFWEAKIAAFELLDLMRADRPRDPALLDRPAAPLGAGGSGTDAALPRAGAAGQFGRAARGRVGAGIHAGSGGGLPALPIRRWLPRLDLWFLPEPRSRWLGAGRL
ncbi:MAG: hypothetical protein M3Y41_09305 [Pseudomonadota bacterium]|nr:hypothetical protein [Pseudomonadota bacterium]